MNDQNIHASSLENNCRWAIVSAKGCICDDHGTTLVWNDKSQADEYLGREHLREHLEKGYKCSVSVKRVIPFWNPGWNGKLPQYLITD